MLNMEKNLDLYEHMVHNDVAFLTLPNVGQITLGGATIMCTHGSSFDCGTFASLVSSFKAVIYRNDKTEIIECDRDSEDKRDIYEAFFPSFGTLGIVYELTMTTVPNYNQMQIRTLVKDTTFGNLRKILEEYNSPWTFCIFNSSTPICTCRCSVPVSPVTTVPTNKDLWDYFSLICLLFIYYSRPLSPDVGWFQKLMRRLIASSGIIMKLHWFYQCPYYPFPVGKPQVLRWHHAELETLLIKYLKRGMRWINLEYAIPIENVDAAFKEVEEYVKEKRGKNFVLISAIRACGADECGYLNPCKGRKTVLFDFTYDSYVPEGFYLELEKILLGHGGRVSWSRLFFSERMQFLKNYPEFDKFLMMKKILDPNNVFGNEWSNRILFGKE